MNADAADGGSARQYLFDKPEETVMHNGVAYRYGGLAEGDFRGSSHPAVRYELAAATAPRSYVG